MQRAAILIGVSKTGNLQRLQAVASGVQAMEQWALDQNLERDLIKVITDGTGRVDVQQIKDAIEQVVERATVDQLIVYFAGHGVNIRYGEYWLLSRAPEDTQAAVNVEGSVVLARQCGIPHVVLISDACRTAAEGIQAQYVTGSEVFPNTGASGLERAVDLFFACTLGKPALEVKDPADAARGYQAVYTEALVDALQGNDSSIIDQLPEVDPTKAFVRPWPLKRYLQAEVRRRLAEARVDAAVTQTPDARITSDERAWLACLPLSRRGPSGVLRGGLPRGTETYGLNEHAEPDTLSGMWRSVLRNDLAGRRDLSAQLLEATSWRHARETTLLTTSLARSAAAFGPDHFPTGCGFKLRGARIRDVYSPKASCEPVGARGDSLQIRVREGPAANVLLTFQDGNGVVLPAIPDFVTAITFEDGELETVTYEPTGRSPRRREWPGEIEELRHLRAVIASSARFGAFQLEPDDADRLASRMQDAKNVDPAMALYAAYAYHDLNRRDRIESLQQDLQNGLGLRLFDIALLARSLPGSCGLANNGVFPFFPLLAQGWALLRAHRVSLPAPVAGIERHLVPSLWTFLDATGVQKIRAAMRAGEV